MATVNALFLDEVGPLLAQQEIIEEFAGEDGYFVYHELMFSGPDSTITFEEAQGNVLAAVAWKQITGTMMHEEHLSVDEVLAQLPEFLHPTIHRTQAEHVQQWIDEGKELKKYLAETTEEDREWYEKALLFWKAGAAYLDIPVLDAPTTVRSLADALAPRQSK